MSLIPGLRRGRFLADAFHVADHLFDETDDLVQKGCGWMLKEASKAHPDAIFTYVLDHRDRLPRTTLRYAIEKLPPAQRRRAMER